MIRYYTMYLVSAFADCPFLGNSTGVVIDSNGTLSDDEMQNIAKDINQSEIVFVKKLDTGRYHTRFFTPNREIKLCGHATIATFYALAQNEYIIPIESGIKEIIQHTEAGKIPVGLEYEDYQIKRVYMSLKVKEDLYSGELDEICQVLGIDSTDMGLTLCASDNLPKKMYSGFSDLLVPVRSVEVLEKIQLNEVLAKEISKREDILSIVAFTTEDGKSVRQRTFSPIIDVYEERGSGTSTAAAMYYLHKRNCTQSNGIISTQGDLLNRTSSIIATFNEEKGCVRVGGRAYVFMNGVLNI